MNRSAATTHRDSAMWTSSGTGFSAVPSASLNTPSVTLKWNVSSHMGLYRLLLAASSSRRSLYMDNIISYTPFLENGALPDTVILWEADMMTVLSLSYFIFVWLGAESAGRGSRGTVPFTTPHSSATHIPKT